MPPRGEEGKSAKVLAAAVEGGGRIGGGVGVGGGDRRRYWRMEIAKMESGLIA